MDKSTRILAVDDSVTIRKALELILVPAGFQVEFAVDGGEALDKVKQFRPDIILLDFILPDMRGTEVCRELLAGAETKNLPVVLISARGAEIRQAYHDVDNVIDYLTKPFTPDAVLGVIREVLATQPGRLAEASSVAAAAEVVARAVPAVEPHADEAEPSSVESAASIVAAAEEEAEGDADDAGVHAVDSASQREGLEAMFETLRAGLEGVYVEEMDSRAGSGADPTRSYADLASRLAQQLGETMEQAESRRPFRLYGDGSLRSLDESLLETYRRVCRLLFRAVSAGAVGVAAPRSRPRLLIVCPRDSEAYEGLAGFAAEPGEAHVFLVASDFRQLPALTRLYGPTHLVVDAGRSGAVWDQLKTLRQLPEARRVQVLAVARREAGEATHMADLDADAILDVGPGLPEALRRRLFAMDASALASGQAPAVSM